MLNIILEIVKNKSIRRKQIKKEKAITLISLVITIIILIILAGVAINLSLGENGLLNKVKYAKEKYELAQIKEKVEIAITSVVAKEIELGNDITRNKILQELLENGTFESIDKESGIGNIDEYEIKLKENEDGSIEIESIEKATGVRITYALDPKGYTNEEKVSILFKVQGKVKSVTKPDNLRIYPNNNVVAIDYEVNSNGTYPFIVENENGETITKNVIVDTIDRLKPKEFTITAAQVDNKLVITANAEDAEMAEDGTSVKSGIGRYEYFVKKSTETNYPEKPYTTNEIEGLAYDTYNIYVKAYDKAGNVKESSNTATVKIQNPKIAKYGQKVNYEANGVSDWKIFYINEDKNETFIITSQYLNVSKFPPSMGTTVVAGYPLMLHWESAPTSYIQITDEVKERFMVNWAINSSNINTKCISRLLDTEAWSVFVTEYLKNKGCKAIGTPTGDMFKTAWNELYPEVKIDKFEEINQEQQGSNVDCSKLVPSSNSDAGARYLALAHPASYGNNEYLVGIESNNVRLNYNPNRWFVSWCGICPVVAVPSDLLEYNNETSSWNIK